jgi:hypothetical protein
MATAKETAVAETTADLPEPDPTLSVLHEHSTYAPDPDDRSGENPPPGPTTIQTLGKAG